MDRQILRKAYSTEPTYGTYWDTKKYSEIPRMNIFPYPFYFVSNPVDDEPTVYSRRAGWSPQSINKKQNTQEDSYPSHCFQSACNNTDTKVMTKNGCITEKCINLER